ncbi:MAG: hypothetical protein JWR02_3035, partial [Mucilaginibacter sp.]|nr:hypothetical protein [Mucilaginibacter sp.]
VTLTAPAGFSAYMWNGEPGRQTYQVGRPQKVSLAVTDGNGCQSVQEINVTEQCPDMHIPDTFTPNHDGINDTWAIGGVENDPSVVVKVFNRYGVLLFENRGYSMPWNGEYAGRRVPAGVYYYMIAAKNGTQHFSGSVTVLY